MTGTTHRFPKPKDRVPALPKPEWLKISLSPGEEYSRVSSIFKELRLTTVCQEAACPNRGECWGKGTATVMLMGEICTRACRFCRVKVGNPLPLDPQEPAHLALAVQAMKLQYVVITSVDRDDLPDGGARHFAQAIRQVRKNSPRTIVECLVPDFAGQEACLDEIGQAGAQVVGHNLETVERLQGEVRDRRASWKVSLKVLEYLKKKYELYTKSSLMLGLGETRKELLSAFMALREVGVDILTIGQYLQPSPYHLSVQKYYPPEEFSELQAEAESMGFGAVAAGPWVRSSYRAAEFYSRIGETNPSNC
jgi:lipoic acid synthetase